MTHETGKQVANMVNAAGAERYFLRKEAVRQADRLKVIVAQFRFKGILAHINTRVEIHDNNPEDGVVFIGTYCSMPDPERPEYEVCTQSFGRTMPGWTLEVTPDDILADLIQNDLHAMVMTLFRKGLIRDGKSLQELRGE